MTVITNLRIPWTTTLPQDNNFDVSRNELVDPGNQIAVLDSAGLPATSVDWQNVDFNNVGNLNGTAISSFLTNINNESWGDLINVSTDVNTSPQEGDIGYYDGANWTRLPRGSDGQFLKSTTTGIAWGTGISAITDFSDQDFRIFNDADATKEVAFDASLITSGQTRTFSLPDGDGTLARLSDIPVVSGTFTDLAFAITDDVDVTKIMKFQVAGVSTATTRTVTMPDKDGTLAMLSDITSPGNTFADNLFRVFDNVDNTKEFALEVQGLTTATTRTWTVPDSDDTLVGKVTTDIFQNKSIDLANNTVTMTKAQLDTAVTDDDVAFIGQANTFGAGFTQSFTHDATNPGMRLVPVAGDPSVLLDGHMWYNQTTNQIFGRINGVNVDMGSVTPQDSAFVITCSDEGTDLDTLNNPKTTFRMTFPFTLNTGAGLNLGVRASVRDAPTGTQDIICDIKQNGVSILSGLLHIDPGDKTSTSSATQATILTSSLTDDAEISVELTQVGDTTPGRGLKVYLIGMS